jgi:hypothetical protein
MTASLAVVMTGALPPYPRDLSHWGRRQGLGEIAFVNVLRWQRERKQAASEDAARAVWPRRWRLSLRLRSCPILHGGADIVPDASSVVAVCQPRHAGGPKALNLGGAGAEPLPSHTRRRSRPCVSVHADVQRAHPQPFQSEPRGEPPPARCPKPTRRNAGLANCSGWLFGRRSE